MIHEGRYFAQRESDFVLFILGMRIHNVWAIRKWPRIYRLIPPMFKELEQQSDLGYLGGMYKLSFRSPLIVQYWESQDHLVRYALSKDKAHLPVWRTFNQLLGKGKDIGIWHETYRIKASDHENIYVNMPFTGLGQFTSLKPVGPGHSKLKERFRKEKIPQ